MDSLDQILFDDKSFGDLLKEIHGNQKKKAKQLASLIAELRPLVQSLGDATVVVPLIKEYMEISVKNDDQLIKMAAIVQRLSTSTSQNGDGGLLGFVVGDLFKGGNGWTELQGYVLLPEVRQTMLALVGFYFGSSQVK